MKESQEVSGFWYWFSSSIMLGLISLQFPWLFSVFQDGFFGPSHVSASKVGWRQLGGRIQASHVCLFLWMKQKLSQKYFPADFWPNHMTTSSCKGGWEIQGQDCHAWPWLNYLELCYPEQNWILSAGTQDGSILGRQVKVATKFHNLERSSALFYIGLSSKSQLYYLLPWASQLVSGSQVK